MVRGIWLSALTVTPLVVLFGGHQVARADCQGGPVLGQVIRAQGKTAFVWTTPVDIEFVKGNLGNVADYATWIRGSRTATSLLDTSEDNPAPGEGVFYLVKLSGPPCGSWQSTPGAEPERDARIHTPCSQLNPTHEQIQQAVDVALVGVTDPWGDPDEFRLVYKRIQDQLGCALEETPQGAPNQLALECSTANCDSTYCCLANYCGVANSSDWGGFGLDWPAGDCFNRACFVHDMCSHDACVALSCFFTPQSDATGCDDTLFSTWLSCPHEPPIAAFTDDIAYTVASGSYWLPRFWCADPPCREGTCNPSTSDCSCDDGNPCTRDSLLIGGRCTHAALEAGTPCGNSSNTACDHPDTCDANATCQANRNAAGAACDDGDACTVGEVCEVDGSCAGFQRDCNDQNPCTNDTCDPAIGCINIPNGSCPASLFFDDFDRSDSQAVANGWTEVYSLGGPSNEFDDTADDACILRSNKLRLQAGAAHDTIPILYQSLAMEGNQSISFRFRRSASWLASDVRNLWVQLKWNGHADPNTSVAMRINPLGAAITVLKMVNGVPISANSGSVPIMSAETDYWVWLDVTANGSTWDILGYFSQTSTKPYVPTAMLTNVDLSNVTGTRQGIFGDSFQSDPSGTMNYYLIDDVTISE